MVCLFSSCDEGIVSFVATHDQMLVAFVPTLTMEESVGPHAFASRADPTCPSRVRHAHREACKWSGGVSPVNDTPLLAMASRSWAGYCLHVLVVGSAFHVKEPIVTWQEVFFRFFDRVTFSR